MNDPEFIELRDKFLKGLGIVLIFIIPFIIFMVKKFNVEDSKVIKKINNEENIVLFVENAKCSTCESIEKILNNLNVEYEIINSSTSKDYKSVLKKLDITTTDIAVPTIIYIEEGKVNTILPSIETEEEITSFVDYYKLGK